jgi:signal transduction histidine kinase
MLEDFVQRGSPPAATEKSATHGVAQLYRETLEADLVEASEAALRRAGEIGRRSVAEGLSLFDLAALHHEVLTTILARTSSSSAQEIRRAGQFFCEALFPYESAHRGSRQDICALRQLNEALEREIQRIAHSVHDEAGPLLDAARLTMSAVAREASPSLQERLREVGMILENANEELRRLSHELRPIILDDLGLVPALQVLAERTSRRSNVLVSVESSLEERAPANLETTLYRVVQEALTNVARHSSAKSVKIEVGRDANSNLRCTIRDDGVGFDVASVLSRNGQEGLGLIGIRERLNAVGGTFQICSGPGRGTELILDIPAEK